MCLSTSHPSPHPLEGFPMRVVGFICYRADNFQQCCHCTYCSASVTRPRRRDGAERDTQSDAYPVADKANVPSGMLSLLRYSSTRVCMYSRTRRHFALYNRTRRAWRHSTSAFRRDLYSGHGIRNRSGMSHRAVINSDVNGFNPFYKLLQIRVCMSIEICYIICRVYLKKKRL